MARKEEQKVWDALKRKRPVDMDLERVENITNDGTPDVHGMFNGASFWLELKAAKMPMRLTTKLLGDKGLRLSQINWHRKAAWHCLPAYTVIRVSIGRSHAWHMIDCQHSAELNDLSVEEVTALSLCRDAEGVFAAIRERLEGE